MKKLWLPVLTFALLGCGDFIDEEGNTSVEQVAQGLQSLGDRIVEMGEAIERDAGIRAVEWRTLSEALPEEIGGVERIEVDGDDATDRNGAGMSIAHGTWVSEGDSMFVGIADLGALRSGAELALRWIAPVLSRDHIDGELEATEVRGYPAVRVRDDEDGDILVAFIVDGRFAVAAGGEGRRNDDFVDDALDRVDYRRLRRWVDYGKD